MAPYTQGGTPTYYGFVNSAGHIAIVACHNNDLANFWEWYGSPSYPLRPRPTLSAWARTSSCIR